MNLFIDTNVVMDFVSDLTYANMVYSGRKIMERDTLYDLLIRLRQHIAIVGVGEDAVEKALHLRPRDFEDALQYFAAKQANADYIITRNKSLEQCLVQFKRLREQRLARKSRSILAERR